MTDLDRLYASFTDPRQADEVDTVALGRLSGVDRDAAVDALVGRLGIDPRAAPALADLGVAAPAIAAAMAAATPSARAAAAVAHVRLGGDRAVAIAALRDVLLTGEEDARIRAAAGLRGLGGDDALAALVAGVRAGAAVFHGLLAIRTILGVPGGFGPHSRWMSVETLLAGPPAVRDAVIDELSVFIVDVRAGRVALWAESAHLDDPRVDALRAWMRPGGADAPFPEAALEGLTEADLRRLMAWAMVHARNGNAKGEVALRALLGAEAKAP